MGKGGASFFSVGNQGSWAGRHRVPELPPPLIPIVFVPGIMGSNLRLRETAIPEARKAFEEEHREAEFTTESWLAPNLLYSELETGKQASQELLGSDCATVRQAKKWDGYGPKLRQVLLNPEATEVDEEGFIPDTLDAFPTAIHRTGPEEARRRGWGGVHWDSYGSFLSYLEWGLNWGSSLTESSVEAQSMKLKHDLMKGQAWSFPEAVLPSFEDLDHAAHFRYPVFAFGYNWAQSNAESAKQLLDQIKLWLEEYRRAGHECHQVVLVTHSMGGLVARAAAKRDKKLILGVIHGVMPATGAPVLYRRMVGGTEHGPRPGLLAELRGAFTLISGRTSADTTPVIANSPGCLELLPSHLYPPEWLRVERDLGHGKVEHLFSLPDKDKNDPYEEIYTQKEAWWRLVDPNLLDPALIHSKTKKGVNPEEAWRKYVARIAKVKKFHQESLDKDDYFDREYAFGFYGSGLETFATIRWRLPVGSNHLVLADIRSAWGIPGDHQTFRRFTTQRWKTKPARGSAADFIVSHDFAGRNQTYLVPGTVDDAIATAYPLGLPTWINGSAHLQSQDGDGDGTVPGESGSAPGDKLATLLGLRRVDHQEAYTGSFPARVFTVLAICRLAKHSSCVLGALEP